MLLHNNTLAFGYLFNALLIILAGWSFEAASGQTYQEFAHMQNLSDLTNERAKERRIDREYVVVSTFVGKIRGYRVKPHEFTIFHKSGSDKEDLPPPKAVDCFMGIPFAQPPVGKLRYQSPQTLDPFPNDYVFNATQLPNSCPQPIDTYFGEDFLGTNQWNSKTPISEDCLYLNIWAPYPRRPENEKLAVLIWVYGGSFASGTITLKLYDGKILASRFNIIVVAINYRLGSFGFLYTNDPVENPGNAGLFDQLMAFKWIKRNIVNFGGDPDRITAVGESAGAVSLAFHLLSPESTNYLNRVILQSSGANNPWGLIDRNEAINRAYKLASQFDCGNFKEDANQTLIKQSLADSDIFSPPNEIYFQNTNDPATVVLKLKQLQSSRKILNCLRSQKYNELIDRDYLVTSDAMDFPFAPVVDGSLLKAHPKYLLDMGLFKKTDILIGSNLNEGTAFLVYYLDKIFSPLRENVTLTPEDFKWSIDRIYFRFNRVAREAVRFHYDVWDDLKYGQTADGKPHIKGSKLAYHPPEERNLDPHGYVRKVEDMAGDFWFICDVNQLADFYGSIGANVYMYRFRHRSTQNPWPKWMGVMHGDEISFMFGEPLKLGSKFTEEERDLSYTIMKFWTNFAKYGDPNKNGEYDWTDIKWPTYSQAQECLDLDLRMSRYNFNITPGPRLKGCAFQKYLKNLQFSTERAKYRSASCPASSETSEIDRSSISGNYDSHKLKLKNTQILLILILQITLLPIYYIKFKFFI